MRTWGVVAAILLVPLVGCSTSDGPEKDEGDEYSAQYICEEFVKDRLKSPATADFSDEDRSRSGPRTWVVSGSVDSENGFGAMIRNTFTCKVRYTGDDNWRLVSLSGLSN